MAKGSLMKNILTDQAAAENKLLFLWLPAVGDGSARESSDDSEAATRRVSDPKSGNWLQRTAKRNITLTGLMDKLLKQTVKRSTWIRVSMG
ncbi:hypothetical protein BDM02DRAFT_3119142 [Thelephora ganbajun]|uniref:Uncharacterized protein n=1 Tax=Thelephora ganbajun TaxID=370292 RepID=A0ACB6Z8U5_THEGA|nr:hypothetical protein BDM02DRAFT_3119142 [Thelephora ganbajun]